MPRTKRAGSVPHELRHVRYTRPEISILKALKATHKMPRVGPEGFRRMAYLMQRIVNTDTRAALFDVLQEALETKQTGNDLMRLAQISTQNGVNMATPDWYKQINRHQITDYVGRVKVYSEAQALTRSGIKINPQIAFAANPVKEYETQIQQVFKDAFGIKEMKRIPHQRVIREIFRYFPKVAGWEQARELQQGSFKQMIKAYVEEGEAGLKKLKFSAHQFTDAIFKVMARADELESFGKTRRINYFEDVFKLSLQNFHQHAQMQNFQFAAFGGQVAQRLKQAEAEIQSIMKADPQANKKLLNEAIIAVSERKTSELHRIIELLKTTSAKGETRTQSAQRNRLLGVLKVASDQIHVEQGMKIFEKILPRIEALKGLPHEKQLAVINELKHTPHLEEYVELFKRLSRTKGLIFGDAATVFESIKTAKEEAVHTASSIKAKITYNLEEIFSADRFRDNCISPDKVGYHVVGFAIDPQESFIGFYSNGEYNGFSLVHVVKDKSGGKEIPALVVEEPYTNDTGQVSGMRVSAEGLAEQIAELAKTMGQPAPKIYYKWKGVPEKLTPYPPVHSNKYYDFLGKTVQ